MIRSSTKGAYLVNESSMFFRHENGSVTVNIQYDDPVFAATYTSDEWESIITAMASPNLVPGNVHRLVHDLHTKK